MKITTLAVFGAGYVLGTKAGRERYAQIVQASARASKRLEEYSRDGSWRSGWLGDVVEDTVQRAQQ